MNLKDVLIEHDFSEAGQDVFLNGGIKTLYPPQAKTIEKGLLKKKSVLMSVPTAAGKTLMAELCMVRSILHDNGRCLYIAPLKALASEKYQEFKGKFSKLGIKVGLAIGDSDSPSNKLNQYQIIIATAEKVDSLLRSKAGWLIEALSVVVLDEIHFINDGLRGPVLEILTARIKQLNPRIQFLALSATVKNAKEMAQWLEAELIHSTWRPIPLKEGVYFNQKIKFDKNGTKVILSAAVDDLSKLTLDTLNGKGQVLIFVNSRRSTQAVAKQISKAVSSNLTDEEKAELKKISEKAVGPASSSTKICQKLGEAMKHGVAFHHAGLKPNQRDLIEQNFKKNLIKAIACTPTLAAGVNLPARRAVIRDIKRFESGLGQAYIPTSEYKQCAGRAGRPQYDEYGEAVLMAKSKSEMDTLFDKYIHADPEPVISKLSNESALRMHILASVAGGYIYDVKGMVEFISHTFYYHQNKNVDLLSMVTDIFKFLNEEGFIEKSGFRFFATTFGALTSRLYIDPLTSLSIRDSVDMIKKSKPYSDVGFLHAITLTPDSNLLNVGKNDQDKIEKFYAYNREDFIWTEDNCEDMEDYYLYLSSVKTTQMLMSWIEEMKEDELCDTYNVGPGDVYRYVDATQWLLYAASRISELKMNKDLTFRIERLRTRVRGGIKEELLDLVRLKGVGRVRARLLFEKGVKTLSDFKFRTADEIADYKQIGTVLARDIYKQLNELNK